jgi:methylmalonyl-CoA mutase cobalamin-binding subunit
VAADRPINADVPEREEPEKAAANPLEEPKPAPAAAEPGPAKPAAPPPPPGATRRRPRVPGAFLLIGGLVVVAIGFIVLALVAGSGGGPGDASTATAEGVSGAEVTDDGPRVFLDALGPLAAHAAQATWAQNFFGVGGLATIQSEPLDDPSAAGDLLKADGAVLAAVAGGPKAEDDALQAAISSLRDAGAKVVYLVGGNDEKATALGADRGVKQGVDLLEILGDALAVLDRPVTTRTETTR